MYYTSFLFGSVRDCLTLMPELLKTREVSVMLRLHPNTVRTLRARGRLPAIRLGGQWFYPRGEIEALLRGSSEVSAGEVSAGDLT